MNIKLAYPFDLGSYKSLFPEIELFDWNTYKKGEVIDLMVFPGGEDVSPEYYLGGDEYKKYKDLCYSSRERDDKEIQILDGCYNGNLKVKKILGVCRGMQFINVMFDGKLYPDLYSYNYGHNRIHEIIHHIPNNLDFLTTVNSLHHQGLRTMGSFNRRGNRISYSILATDTANIIPEIVHWDSERILGVQFHPEYFDDDFEGKIMFREFCYKWANGEEKIVKVVKND